MAKVAPKGSTLEPRLLTLDDVAAYMRMSKPEFCQQLPELSRQGFPDPVPVTGLWDRKVIDIWLDRASGLSSERYGFHAPEPVILDKKKLNPTKRRSPSAMRRYEGYTVSECLDDYMRWFRAHRRRIKETEYQINARIRPHFGHRLVSSLTVHEIRKWHEAIAKSPKSIHVAFGKPRRYGKPPSTPEEKRKRRSTANRDLSILKAALNMALRDGHIDTDVGWRGALQFRQVEVSSAECLSINECQVLMPFLTADFRELVRGALFTGARFAELSVLAAGDFDDRAGSIYLSPSKNFSDRHVILTEEGCAFFRRMTFNLHKNDMIFRRADGEPWRGSDCSHRLKIPCQLAGMRHVTFHMFRHTYASLLAMSGVPIPAIAKNLGHHSTETCEKYYAHFTKNYVVDSIRNGTPRLGIDAHIEGDIRGGKVGIRTNRRDTPVPPPEPRRAQTFTRAELLKRARLRGLTGYSHMSKQQLEQELGL
ncbi:tyrosine-type recombinase/integrase [Ferrovibrio xuzhouensis]|uniref:Tyrosine-type recombinase/integrase n=1 Tax=Ferrovibrio xuzhouensis TaxID=1576914 RepID=A0ABV7VK03_9PROT